MHSPVSNGYSKRKLKSRTYLFVVSDMYRTVESYELEREI